MWRRRRSGRTRYTRRDIRIADEGPVEKVDLTDEAVAGAVHDAETDEPEEYGTYHEVHEVLHKYVGGILGACETGFHESEARLHPEDKHCCKKYPNCVKTVDC